jgi:hypothetical protein
LLWIVEPVAWGIALVSTIIVIVDYRSSKSSAVTTNRPAIHLFRLKTLVPVVIFWVLAVVASGQKFLSDRFDQLVENHRNEFIPIR